MLRVLQFDDIPNTAAYKLPLRSLVATFLDVFSEADNDVGSTDLIFQEIDTGNAQPLRQPARRLAYGEQRAAVEHEIEKLVNAGIARPSTSPWA